MTELDIIKELFKAFSSRKPIILNTQDGIQHSGTIQNFDGETITIIDGCQLTLSNIVSVEACEDNQGGPIQSESRVDYQDYKTHEVDIVYNRDDNQVELTGYLFDIRSGLIALVTKTKREIIPVESIVSISYAQEHLQDAFVSHSTNDELSLFEKALIEGDKETAESYLENPENLKAQNYSDEEIRYIQKHIKVPVPWADDDKNRLYNQARRIYEYEGNRHRIASNLLVQYVNGTVSYYKTRIKAVALLVDIYAEEQPKELLPFFAQNEDLIRSDGRITLKVATAFAHAGEYEKARMLVDETRADVDFSGFLFYLSFYEEHAHFDFSSLPGVDAFDKNANLKELVNLTQLPNKNAFIQLLSAYSDKGRFSSFFSLLDLFMPYARNDSRVVSLTGECLLKDGAESYLRMYLPMFPLLWLNKSLTSKYLNINGEYACDNDVVMHLLNQSRRTAKYALPNELEGAVINGNYELFEVLRGNNSILLSLGYTPDEIDQIRAVDADVIRYGNKTIVEKLLSLEGNRNYVPESTAGKDFLFAPKAVGEILFPILIVAECGDLVYEMFNYSPRIRSQLSSLTQFYIKALILLKKDEELWELVKDTWLTMKLDSEALSVAQRVAKEKGAFEVADAMRIYTEKAPFNDLENALISGSIAKLRSLISDADYLLDTGYTLEEIKLLQESMRRSIDTSLNDHLSIANRVYTFQKNKNQTAELYYMLSLADGNELAASGLFSIYANEKRYRELCYVFEKHLLNDSFGAIVQNKELYLIGLYEAGDFGNFYSYWKEEHSDIHIDPVIVLKVLLRISAPESEVEEVLKTPIKVDNTNKGISRECLIMLCQRGNNPAIAAWIIRLFNAYFLVCDKQDAQMLKDNLDTQS